MDDDIKSWQDLIDVLITCDDALLSKDIECAEDGGSEHFVSNITVDQNEGVLYLNLC
tara:strand:+ start:94 stop:264 length:171 start_codon:yes stop_codon:yes gene_type:complete